MPVTIGGLRERVPGETRVSLVPEITEKLAAATARVLLERGAGVSAQFPDALYKKVEWADSAEAVLAAADVLLTVQPLSVAQIQLL
jgi:H+-translocating NAD(P) transhydrogenase subunit alpha